MKLTHLICRQCLWAAALLFTGHTVRVSANPTEASAPLVPSFQVDRYEITGPSVLDQAAVNQAMAGALGANVTVPQIRQALKQLQQTLRDRGFAQSSLTLPRQALTNGVVVVKVTLPAETSPTTPAAFELPSSITAGYSFKHFEIYGNTALTPEEIDLHLGPVAGETATLAQLEKALARLQAAYLERGYDNASVRLPQQVLTDGTVIVKVEEGLSREARTRAAHPPAKPAAPAVPPRTLEVHRYEVTGNTLLTPETIEKILASGTGTNVTIAQIDKAKGELQLAYRERGFSSVSVTTPPQQVTNAIVHLHVTEGRLVDARVIGNRYFSSNNVMRSLPTVREAVAWQDQVVNSKSLQRELDLSNQNRDRQIYPVINPGPDPGTSALELRVKDRLPLHGRLEVNNQSTPGTPDWRINANASYANLWQREHVVGVSYGFTPEEFKSPELVNDYFFNRPLIANYGAYYRIPFGEVESIQDQVNSSSSFGYDEATRQFRLPPAGGRPDLTFSASGSSSDTGLQFSPVTVVSQTPLLLILSRETGQELTIDRSAGVNFNLPHTFTETKKFNFSVGMDWKHNEKESYNTNNFLIVTVITNSQGSQTIESEQNIGQPIRRTEVNYAPINMGFTYSDLTPRGSYSANLILSANTLGDPDDFAETAYTTKARAQYGKAFLTLTHDRKVFKNWSLLLRGNGQAATGPLISNEQFAVGGLNSVRGYYEGDERGDAGWFASAELRTPLLLTEANVLSGPTPVWLRGSAFLDAGQRFILDNAPGVDAERFLWSAGLGVSASLNQKVELKITLGVPLADTYNTRTREPRVHFSLGGQF